MNRRLGITIGALVIWLTITVFGGRLFAGGDVALQDLVSTGIGWALVMASGFILLVCLWQGWSDVGLNRGFALGDLRLAWLPMIYIFAALGMAAVPGLPSASVLIFIAINCAFVGFSEELMLRGAVLQALRRTVPIWQAVLLTSVVFGAMHSLNVFITGDLQQALIQSSAAFLSGLLFIALRLRTGSLWLPIVLHALWDFATFTLASATGAAHHGNLPVEAVTIAAPSTIGQLFPVLLVLPNAICGIWLMRDIGRTHTHPET